MSTITKEWLKQRITDMEAARDEIPFGLDEDDSNTLAALRIALASLEAEPVAWRYFQETPADGGYWILNDYKPNCSGVESLYTAPPAPVAVPEVGPVAYIFKHPAGRLFWSLTDESNKGQSDVIPVYAAPVPAFVPPAIEPDYEVIKGILPTANPDEYACCIAADMWNSCRAAMLQSFGNSEQLNSPVIPDGWVACVERMPENDDFVYIWPRPDFGVELHVAQYGKFDKRGAGWYAQVYEQNYGIEYYPVKPTHWMPLPAAPQQEVKP